MDTIGEPFVLDDGRTIKVRSFTLDAHERLTKADVWADLSSGDEERFNRGLRLVLWEQVRRQFPDTKLESVGELIEYDRRAEFIETVTRVIKRKTEAKAGEASGQRTSTN